MKKNVLFYNDMPIISILNRGGLKNKDKYATQLYFGKCLQKDD